MNEIDCLRAIVGSAGLIVNPAAFVAYLATLPNSDPHVVNQPWNNGGTLSISQG